MESSESQRGFFVVSLFRCGLSAPLVWKYCTLTWLTAIFFLLTSVHPLSSHTVQTLSFSLSLSLSPDVSIRLSCTITVWTKSVSLDKPPLDHWWMCRCCSTMYEPLRFFHCSWLRSLRKTTLSTGCGLYVSVSSSWKYLQSIWTEIYS